MADERVPYVAAANEGDAVAIATGAQLGGHSSVVFFQNSGLGNAVNPLTSLTWTFRVPLLIVTTWRGEPGGNPDEPQHDLMGAVTTEMLEAMRIPWSLVPHEASEFESVLAAAREHLDSKGTPYALIVRKGVIGDGPGRTPVHPRSLPAAAAGASLSSAAPQADIDQDRALQAVVAACEADAVITTTGYTGRALYAIADRPGHLYMVGSMGCASSIALGLALTCPEKRTVALDGDGAFLMRMGALATIGEARPANLVHVLLDNGVHDSTGAQATVSRSIDPVGVALACGYARALRVETASELERELRAPSEELTFLHVRTAPRADRKLPRPHVAPHEVAQRLRAWLRSS